MKKVIVFFIVILLSGCATRAAIHAEDYAKYTPQLKIQHYFNGKTIADGVIFNRDDKLTREFHRTITGIWKHNHGLMTEKIRYADGARASREWCIHIIDEHHFIGVSTDVAGIIRGEQFGNVIHMTYRPSIAIDVIDNLHTPGEGVARFQHSPFTAMYSLFTAGSWYSGIKALNKLRHDDLTHTKKSPITADELGAFCQTIKKHWRQQTTETNLTNDDWMYAVDKNKVIEKVAISQRNLVIGTIISSFEKNR
jgi:hypothetical protein